MKAAIKYLEQTLEMLMANEPINRARGDIGQADLEARDAAEIRDALAYLREVG